MAAPSTPKECMNCSKLNPNIWIVPECKHIICTTCLLKKEGVKDCTFCNNVKYVECINESVGCTTIIRRDIIKDLRGHLKTCEFQRLPCPNQCPMKIHSYDLVKHLGDECTRRLIACDFCRNNFYSEEISGHLMRCECFPSKCQFCPTVVPRKDVEAHLKHCPCAIWDCDLSVVGCRFRGTTEELENHHSFRSHVKLFVEYVEDSKATMESLGQEVSCLKTEVNALKKERKTSEERIKTLEERTAQQVIELTTYKEDNERALLTASVKWKEYVQDFCTDVKEQMKNMNDDAGILKESVENLETKFINLTMKLQVLNKMIKTLENTCENYAEQLNHFEKFAEENPTVSQTINPLISCFSKFKEISEVLIYLQKLSCEREIVSFQCQRLNYEFARMWFNYDPVKVSWVQNVAFIPLTWLSRTFVFRDGPQICSTQLTVSKMKVQLMIRFKFILLDKWFKVYALVTQASLPMIDVEFKACDDDSILLSSRLDLSLFSPIYCGEILKQTFEGHVADDEWYFCRIYFRRV